MLCEWRGGPTESPGLKLKNPVDKGGMAEGAGVGSPVGAAVGSPVGAVVGSAVGAAVGSVDGTTPETIKLKSKFTCPLAFAKRHIKKKIVNLKATFLQKINGYC